MPIINYDASPTATKFHMCDDFVRFIMGPLGSGKSVACVMEMMKRSFEQEPGPDGIRRTRWAIIRNSYGELRDTTMKTFKDWVPEQAGTWHIARNEFIFKQGDVEVEFLFRALDRPQDTKKLLSLELTGAFLNEAREIPKAVFDAVQGRVGRYPSKKDGGPTWTGVFLDSNPCDTDHWLYRLFEEDKPKDWSIFRQPSGLADNAENIDNLPGGVEYYNRMMPGKTDTWIDVYVHGTYGDVSDGRPVYPEFNDAIHSVQEDAMPLWDPAEPVYMGQDYGLTPAAAFAQKLQGHWYIFQEVVTENMGAVNFAKECNDTIAKHFPGARIIAWGDPAAPRSQSDESTPIQIMINNGIPTQKAETNDPVLRREAVASPMQALAMDGKPVFQISSACKTLRKGLNGRYCYKRIQVAGDERYKDEPDKNLYSHVNDALQYLMIGAGEGKAVIRGEKTKKWAPLKDNRKLGLPRR